MAFVAKVFAWQVSIGVRDNNAKSSTVQYSVDGTATMANVEAQATAVANAVQALTDAYVTGIDITYQLENNAGDVMNATSEIERKLTMAFIDDGGNTISVRDIPSPVSSIEINGTDTVDPAGTLIADYIAALVAAGAKTSRGDALTTVQRAYVKHRSRKVRA